MSKQFSNFMQKMSFSSLACNIKNTHINHKKKKQAIPLSVKYYDSSLDNFQELYGSLIDMYNKRKYRKLFTQLSKNEKTYLKYNITNNLELTHLQIECVFQIIKKKFFKYNSRSVIKNIDNWLNITDGLIDKFYHQIDEIDEKKKISQFEFLTQYTLRNMYNYALYNKHVGKIVDCISYLSMSEKLIQNFSSIITYPETYTIISHIFLFLSSFMISEESFSTAKNYIVKTLKLLLREIELRMKNSNIHYLVQEEKESSPLNIKNNLFVLQNSECFLLLGISFYQLGVCFENEGEIMKASDSYMQAKHFFEDYLPDEYCSLTNFLTNVSDNCKNKNDFIQIILRKEAHCNDYEEKKVKKKRPKLYFDDEERLAKFDNIKNYLQTLNLKEIDDEDQNLLDEIGEKPKSQFVKKMTKHVHLYNYLMSDDFKPVVTQMKSLEVNKLDDETKRTIQKKIIKIKAEQRAKNTGLSNSSSLSSFKQISSRENRNHKSSISSKHKRNITLTKSTSAFTHYSVTETHFPAKINYDNYVFRKSYKKKFDVIDDMNEREYNFQKNILFNKKYETFQTVPYEIDKIKRNAETFYKLKLEERIKIIKEKEKSVKANAEKANQNNLNKLREQYRRKACKSLDIFAKDKFLEIIKNYKKSSIRLKNKQPIHFDEEKGNENNKIFLNKLNLDIDNLVKKEDKMKKKL